MIFRLLFIDNLNQSINQSIKLNHWLQRYFKKSLNCYKCQLQTDWQLSHHTKAKENKATTWCNYLFGEKKPLFFYSISTCHSNILSISAFVCLLQDLSVSSKWWVFLQFFEILILVRKKSKFLTTDNWKSGFFFLFLWFSFVFLFVVFLRLGRRRFFTLKMD